MKVAIFSAKGYEREAFGAAEQATDHELVFLEGRLDHETVRLAGGFAAICVFVNDIVDGPVIDALAAGGTRVIALRSAGFNHVDMARARARGMTVVRVPAYSPHAVAEHTAALVLALDRRIHRAHNRVREGNFALDGLLGFDLCGRTVGIVGTGRIGTVVARIFTGFGMHVLLNDRDENPTCRDLGGHYVDLPELLNRADVITLHCPLTPETHHMIDARAIDRMKPGAMLINTSRGALIDTRAVIAGLKSGKIGNLGLDVYEEEGDLFFEDLSNRVIQDDVFTRLLTFPNVLITGHQAFFTREALTNIVATTLQNISDCEAGRPCTNEVDDTLWSPGPAPP